MLMIAKGVAFTSSAYVVQRHPWGNRLWAVERDMLPPENCHDSYSLRLVLELTHEPDRSRTGS